MDERKQLFLMLVQTYAIMKALRDHRSATVPVYTLAVAFDAPIDNLSRGGLTLADAAIEFVNFEMQTYANKVDRKPPPDWTRWT